jgi:hypothetical protein
MITLYLCFLAGGAVLPFVSFILGSFGNGADTDIDTGADIGTHTGFDTHMDIDTGADIGSHTDFDTHADLGGHTDLGTHSHIGADTHTMFSIGLIPTSLMSLSALAVTFGAVGGLLTYSGKGTVITLAAAIVVGYVASVFVQTLIKTLKKAQTNSYGIDEKELLLYDGKVVDTILPGQLGTVSFTTLKNVMVSYPAKCVDESLRIQTGKIVKVIEFREGIVFVEAQNKYE